MKINSSFLKIKIHIYFSSTHQISVELERKKKKKIVDDPPKYSFNKKNYLYRRVERNSTQFT